MIIPLALVVLIGVGVGWEMFRARMEELQQGQGGDARLGVVGSGPAGQRDRKSREVRVGEQVAPVAPVGDDDLTGLGTKKKPPPPKPTAPLTAVERAWRGAKGSYDKLESRNESTARRYRIRVNALEGRKESASEPTFVKEAGVLEEELRAELAKPENQ